MIGKLKPGDKVQLTTRDLEPDYRVGEIGTVESGPHGIPSGGEFYLIRMDRDSPNARAIVFRGNEIEIAATKEPDENGRASAGNRR